jgi:F420-dependent oxidoreductase-like protein
MRVCLMIEGQEDVTWEDWVALATACEEHGIETLFRSDHYLSVEGKHDRVALDAWATLAALAAMTTKLRLGTMVSPASFRHPSELAKVVTTVDHVSGGRVELGLGAGWNEREHRAFGFPFLPQAERLDVLEEQLDVVGREWADERFSYAGRYYMIEELHALPKPVQSPRPPIILGGSGRPRSLSLAARFADEYNTTFKTPDECADIRRRLDEACEEEGRAPIPLSLMTGWLSGADRAEVLDRAGRLAEWNGEAGSGEELLAGLPDSWIAAPLDEAIDRLHHLHAVGVDRVMLQHLLHRDLDAVEQIGRHVAPVVG